jgi:hypothetical protein
MSPIAVHNQRLSSSNCAKATRIASSTNQIFIQGRTNCSTPQILSLGAASQVEFIKSAGAVPGQAVPAAGGIFASIRFSLKTT